MSTRRVFGYMAPEVFDLALKRIGAYESKAKSWTGPRLMLVDGMRVGNALRKVNLGKRSACALYRAIDRIEESYTSIGICPCCGGPFNEV